MLLLLRPLMLPNINAFTLEVPLLVLVPAKWPRGKNSRDAMLCNVMLKNQESPSIAVLGYYRLQPQKPPLFVGASFAGVATGVAGAEAAGVGAAGALFAAGALLTAVLVASDEPVVRRPKRPIAALAAELAVVVVVVVVAPGVSPGAIP